MPKSIPEKLRRRYSERRLKGKYEKKADSYMASLYELIFDPSSRFKVKSVLRNGNDLVYLERAVNFKADGKKQHMHNDDYVNSIFMTAFGKDDLVQLHYSLLTTKKPVNISPLNVNTIYVSNDTLDTLREKIQVVVAHNIIDTTIINYTLDKLKNHIVSTEEEQLYHAIVKLFMQRSNLSHRGYTEEAKLVSDIAYDMFATTIDYFSLPPDQKNKHTANYIDLINSLANKGIDNKQLSNHRGVRKIFENFLLAASVLGLVYLAATKNKRHSFWYHPDTSTLSHLKDIAQQTTKLKR